MMRPVLLIALLAALWAAPVFAGGGELTDQDLAAGRKLYVAKCAKCHKFYEPKGYSQPEWDRWMSLMSRKSKLKPAQEKELSDYLDAYRRGQIPAAH
jgi:cytochrome c553